MSRITIDPQTLAKLNGLDSLLEFCDESGRTLGYFLPPGSLKSLSPLSDAEISRRRLQRTGRPLQEILQDLGRRS